MKWAREVRMHTEMGEVLSRYKDCLCLGHPAPSSLLIVKDLRFAFGKLFPCPTAPFLLHVTLLVNLGHRPSNS